MCDCNTHNPTPNWTGDRKFRLADFFGKWWDVYVQSPEKPIAPEHFKAVNAMKVCRTEALGIDHYACPDCGELTPVYHSCKNRFCPTCSWQDTVKWADKVKEKMLNVPHRHAVFTLPHALNSLIKRNDKHLLNFLFQVSADTLKDWLFHKYKVNPGIISVLHTFGETKQYHPHIHMILSWGGMDKHSLNLKDIKGEFVNYKFLTSKFRCKFEDKLTNFFDQGKLNHSFKNRIEFMQFLKKINDKSWCIHLEPPMEVPTQVIRYIGRYSKRACLSEHKISNIEGEFISFRYKDYKDLDADNKPKVKELTLNYREFFPRLLQHVPLPYFRIVRYYGAYANKSKIHPDHRYVGSTQEKNNIEKWGDLQEKITGDNPLFCEHCQKEKVYVFSTVRKLTNNKAVVFERFELTNKKDKRKKLAA